MSKDLSFRPKREIVEAVTFKVRIRNTEHVFDDMESAKMFNLGYSHGIKGKEPMSLTKPYKNGYHEGANELARGTDKSFCEYSQL